MSHGVDSFEYMTVRQVQDRFDFTPEKGWGFSLDWSTFMADTGLSEYPSVDYVNGLAAYLAERSRVISRSAQEKTRILEVAAGTGLLTELVSNALGEIRSKSTVFRLDIIIR
jgi:ubiquinone/menaquinone biosynthesis C-methylase UbiE